MLKNVDRSWRAFEEKPEVSVYLNAAQPTLATQLTVGRDSLLLSLLQLMVPALLVLQQHPSVLQVPGEVVTLPLQLVSHLLGIFIRTLQLPKLWKEESERVAGAHPTPFPRSAAMYGKGCWKREDLRGEFLSASGNRFPELHFAGR